MNNLLEFDRCQLEPLGTVGQPPVREHQPPTAHLWEPAAKGFEEFIVEQGAPNLKEEMGATP